MTEQPVTTPDQAPSQALARSAAEVGTLREKVQSGSLRLDPATGEEIRSMLVELSGKVDTWLAQAGSLAHPAPLGQNPVGTAMAAKFVSLAHSEEESLADALRCYRQVLTDAYDAVTDAVRRYQVIDDAAAQSFRALAR